MDLHLPIEKDRLINSIKTAIACLIGFFIAEFFELPMSAWILMTIIVVMSAQINVGGVVIKSSMQFIGTIAGALVAGIVLVFFHDKTIPLTIILFLSIFGFSYLASSQRDVSNVGLLGATTVIMVLLSQDPSYKTALLRFLEIMLGVSIAFIMSKFIFPIHAYKKIYDSIADTMEGCLQLYGLLWKEGNENQDLFAEEEAKIINIFVVQRKLVKEAMNELSTRTANKLTYSKILKSQREIFRYICLMHHALTKLQFIPDLEDQLSLFNQHVYLWLEQIVKGLKENNFKLESDKITNKELIPLIKGFTQASPPSPSQQLALDAFFFCALNLVRELRKLTRLLMLLLEKQGRKRRIKHEQQSSDDTRRRRTLKTGVTEPEVGRTPKNH